MDNDVVSKDMTFDEFREELMRRMSERYNIPTDDFDFLPNGITATEENAAFYPGVCEKIASLIGGSFYIAFTSINDCMLHPVNSTTPAAIRANLNAINKR